MKLKFLAALTLSATLYSCDDETVGIGQFIVDNELIPANAASYPVLTQSLKLDSVYSRSSTAYLGKFTDKEYGHFSSDFLVQINCPENFTLPKKLYTDNGANPIEEISLGLYYSKYFGDSLATLRVQVDTLNVAIKDNGKDKNLYYSNLNPKNYYDPSQPALAVKDYSAYDKSISDSIRNATDAYGQKTYYPNVNINLGQDFCHFFYEKYKHTETVNGKIVHPYFKDAESFVNNVVKGFYVHTTNGDGSILYLSDIYLRLKIKYWQEREGKKDTLVTGYVQMASTKEVFMTSRFENSNFDGLISPDAQQTYLKTPAGICTEVTLPLEDMYKKHRIEENDTLNAVYVSFQKMKEKSEGPFKMGTPAQLLLVRKDNIKQFFEGNEVNDNKTSFLAVYDSRTNSYKFSKLNRLISSIFNEMSLEYEKGEKAWEAWTKKNPNWDKVLLIPVAIEKDSQGKVIKVENDLNVNSATLQRGKGKESNIKMEVIYTQPHQR